jgi:hypothetical protein
MPVHLIVIMIHVQNYCKNLASQGIQLHLLEQKFWISISSKCVHRKQISYNANLVWLFPQRYICQLCARIPPNYFHINKFTALKIFLNRHFYQFCSWAPSKLLNTQLYLHVLPSRCTLTQRCTASHSFHLSNILDTLDCITIYRVIIYSLEQNVTYTWCSVFHHTLKFI